MLDFVENYRKLTRIPTPTMQIFPISVLFSDLQKLVPADGIHVVYSIRPAELRLYADRSMIEQVLINLLKNAVEACCDSESPEIRVEAFRQDGMPVITVSDNGSGIVPEALDKVFVPFFTTKQGGSGIGLSVCRQILNRHGGNITVTSEMEKGTVFTPAISGYTFHITIVYKKLCYLLFQIVGFDRFGYVIAEAALFHPLFVFGKGKSGHGYDGDNGIIFAYLFRCLVSVHKRHFQIHEDHVRMIFSV